MENLTAEQYAELYEYDTYDMKGSWQEFENFQHMATFEKCLYPVIVIGGIPVNILALVILFRRSLYVQRETYVYLATLLINSTVQLGFVYVAWWLALFHETYHIGYSSDVVCKFWILLTRLVLSSDWVQFAMLLSFYTRLRLERTENSSSCLGICRKWCTLRGAVICVGLVYAVLVIVNLWYFVIATAEHLDGHVRLCYAGEIFSATNRFVKLSLNCIVSYAPVIVLTPVLSVMIIVSTNKRLGFAFSRLEDAGSGSPEVGAQDSQEVGKAALWLSLVFVGLRTPFLLMQMLDEGLLIHEYKAFFFCTALSLLHPVAPAIVCFTVLSRFRQEARAVLVRCWFFALSRCPLRCRRRRRGSLPVAWNSGSTFVLQLECPETDIY